MARHTLARVLLLPPFRRVPRIPGRQCLGLDRTVRRLPPGFGSYPVALLPAMLRRQDAVTGQETTKSSTSVTPLMSFLSEFRWGVHCNQVSRRPYLRRLWLVWLPSAPNEAGSFCCLCRRRQLGRLLAVVQHSPAGKEQETESKLRNVPWCVVSGKVLRALVQIGHRRRMKRKYHSMVHSKTYSYFKKYSYILCFLSADRCRC